VARKKKEPAPGTAELEEAPVPEVSTARDKRLRGLASVAKKFEGWRPARDVLVRVEAVPTIFPQFDRATRVGGMPLARFATVHGPSNHGKTAWCIGIGASFLARDHFFGLVDAERTTPMDWVEKLMGEQAIHPGFVAMRPTSYEQTVDSVRSFLTNIGEAREKGDIDEKTTGVVVVDSIRKLVPQNILDRLLKEGAESAKGSIDGFGGRAAQIKAAINSAWLDEVTMLLEQTNTVMVAIARESKDVDADANARKYGTDWKVTGGGALIFDSSLVVRITRAAWVKVGSGDDAKETIGERHQGRIWKTKVGAKDDRHTDFYFHTSNGKQTPEGFDRARDVLELGVRYGIVKAPTGAWLTWGANRWNGQNAAVRKLSEDPEKLGALELEVRARFSPDEEIESEGDDS